VILDDTVTAGQTMYKEKATETFSFVDDESMTIKGQSFSVTKLQSVSVTTVTTTPPGTTSTSTGTSFAYFAPSLGYITKSETPVSTDPTSGTKSQGRLSILFDYTEK
jgi:hypothetical protein